MGLQTPSHQILPGAQQCPFEHDCFKPQTFPQEPQFFLSDRVSVHVPLHRLIGPAAPRIRHV